MDVGKLMEEGKKFLSKLPRSGRILLLADDDADGIISAHLFARYYHKRSPYTSILISVLRREEVPGEILEHPGYVPILLDISPDRPILELAESSALRIFVVDHHPVVRTSPRIVQFNPHLYGIPHASRYNTGFLVFLLFRDDIVKNGDLWKVAVSSFGDSSYDYLKSFFYGLDRHAIEIASHIVGSVGHEKLGLLFSALEESHSVEDFIAIDELISLKKEFEKTLLDLVSNVEAYCHYCEGRIRVILLPEELARFKSAVATVYSKRNPDLLVAVGVKEGNWYNFSLRMQRASESGVHLGRFASRLSSLWGTRGGGHAPASGIKVPVDRLDEFVYELRALLSSE